MPPELPTIIDLEAVSLALATTTLDRPGSVAVVERSYRVKNSFASSPIEIEYLLSSDGTPDANDVLLGSETILPGPDCGTGPHTGPGPVLQVPADAPWSDHPVVLMVVDPANDTAETQEDNNVFALPVTLVPPPTITGWEVAADHGSAGKFHTPFTDGYVEPRECGLTELRVTFDQAVELVTVSGSVVTVVGTNSGDVSSRVDSVSLDPTNTRVTIVLVPALPDQDTYTVAIGPGVQSTSGTPLEGDRDIEVSTLAGDVTGSGLVDNSDMIAVCVRRMDSLTSANAGYDVNCDGTINNNDMIAIRIRRGNQL